ncbi:MAG TPA: MBL fold metallo-hydrolase [Thermoleophilia bacterium]|nr:MBL fold metallo-hydrolase [Thermoleophilia bacterium]
MGSVSVTFLGSGDAFGSGGRFQTCILVSSDGERFLIDCGASSLIAIKKRGIDPSLIGTILITHLHGDHFGGLPFFILDAQFSKRDRPLLIAGPPGLRERLVTAMEAFFPKSSQTKQRFAMEVLKLPPGSRSVIGTLRVTAEEVVHFCAAPPYALRVECNGRTIAYSGDTEWTDTLLRMASGADLFICEAYYFEKKVPFHLDYASLAARRDKLGCKRLILTHLSDDMIRRAPDLPVECAEDGKTISI